MGLFDMGGADPGALYGQGLLTPEQKQAIAFRGLLGAAGSLGQAAMPSRMPVPIGAVLGAGAAGMGQAEDQAGQQALQGGLLGLQGQQMRFKIRAAQQLMQALGQGGGGLLGAPPAQGVPGMMPAAQPPSGAAGPGLGSGMAPPIGGPAPVGGSSPQTTVTPLPLIRKAESNGNYFAGYGGTDLSKAPLDSTGFPIWEGKDGPEGPSHAAGAYQIQPDLWHKYAPMAGVKDFSPASQDAVAQLIYANEGLTPWKANPRIAPLIPAGQGQPISAASGMPQAPSYDVGGAMRLGLLGDIAGFPSVGQMVTQSPGYQAAVAGAKAGAELPSKEEIARYNKNLEIAGAGPIAGAQASAKFPYENQLQLNKPYDVRAGAAHFAPGSPPVYGQQLIQVTNPDGSKSFVYMTPNGITPTGQSAGLSPQASSYQKTTGKNQANYGDYLSAPPSGAPASNAAPSGMVTGGAVPGAAPGTSPYGVPPSLQRPPAALAPDQPDPLKFQTQPFKTSQGTVIPPLSAEFKPTAPEALKAAIPDWQKAQGEMVESLEPSLQAKQRLQTFSEMMQDVQSGSFMSHKAQWASDLRGLGLGTIANAIMSAKDAADVQTAIHENYQSTLATLKSSTNRFTQKEFQTISENQVSPDLQPAANQRILAENVAFLNRQIQMAQDWNTAARGGWKNPDSFETEWNRINPVPKSVEQATGEIGPLKGVNATSSQPAANTKLAEAPEGTVVHMKDGSLRIKLQGQWNTIPASSFATAPIPPR